MGRGGRISTSERVQACKNYMGVASRSSELPYRIARVCMVPCRGLDAMILSRQALTFGEAWDQAVDWNLVLTRVSRLERQLRYHSPVRWSHQKGSTVSSKSPDVRSRVVSQGGESSCCSHRYGYINSN